MCAILQKHVLRDDNASQWMSVSSGCGSSSSTHPLSASLPKKTTHTHMGAVRKFPKLTLSPPICLPLSTSASSPSLQLHCSAPLGFGVRCSLRLGLAKGQQVGLGIAAASRRGEAGGGARHALKGINNLNKVVLREVRSSSTEVPVCHSRESPSMFRLPGPDADP
jgi:hypothetical protein